MKSVLVSSHTIAPERAEVVARFIATHPPEVVLHALALRLAKGCRERIQCVLREEEWADCDEEFYRVIREGLSELGAAMKLGS